MSTILDALRKLESERRGDEDPVYRNISAGSGSVPVRSGPSRRLFVTVGAAALLSSVLALGYFWMRDVPIGSAEFPAGSTTEARATDRARPAPSRSLPSSGARPTSPTKAVLEGRLSAGQAPARAPAVVAPDALAGRADSAKRPTSVRARAALARARRSASPSPSGGQAPGSMSGSGSLQAANLDSALARPASRQRARSGSQSPNATRAMPVATEPVAVAKAVPEAPESASPAEAAAPVATEPVAVAKAVPEAPESVSPAEAAAPVAPEPVAVAKAVPEAPESVSPAEAAAPVAPEPVAVAEAASAATEPAMSPERAQVEPAREIVETRDDALSRARVLYVRWHPSAERRLVRIRFDQSGPYDLQEGDEVAGVLIYRIHPASVEVRKGSRTATLTIGD